MKKRDRTKSFKVDQDLEAALRRAARDRSQTVSNYVRDLMEWSLARQGYLQTDALLRGMEAAFGEPGVSTRKTRLMISPDPPQGPEAAARSEEALLVDAYRFSARIKGERLKNFDAAALVLDWLNLNAARSRHSARAFVVFSELFNNALDHGLLGLDSRLKLLSEGFEAYLAERERRLEALRTGFIDIQMREARDRPLLLIRLKDSGPGFDHEAVLKTEPPEGVRPFGHGIPLVKSLCPELHYIGNGNEVIARYFLDRPLIPAEPARSAGDRALTDALSLLPWLACIEPTIRLAF